MAEKRGEFAAAAGDAAEEKIGGGSKISGLGGGDVLDGVAGA